MHSRTIVIIFIACLCSVLSSLVLSSSVLSVDSKVARDDTLETAADDQCVILLHSLGRSASSMTPIAKLLERQQYHVANIRYPSRKFTLENLADNAIRQGLEVCESSEKIHFVTHSMGGILVRAYLEKNTIDTLGHVVMLGPPNQGSPVVDAYSNWPYVKEFGGPAFMALSPSEGSVMSLGDVDFSLGVIAGSRSVNPILSLVIKGPDDGKVQVDDTRVEGMSDFKVVSSSHPMLMRNAEVQESVLCFLSTGLFCSH